MQRRRNHSVFGRNTRVLSEAVKSSPSPCKLDHGGLEPNAIAIYEEVMYRMLPLIHSSQILSQGTDGVDKSVYSTGLPQLLRPPLLLLCKSCWVPWKGAKQVTVCRPSPKYSDNLCSIDKYNLHCLLVSSEHILLIHAHMLSEGHKKRCFGAK